MRQADLSRAYVRMLRKNKAGFGKMSFRQKHYYYTYLCENEKIADMVNAGDLKKQKRYAKLYRMDFAVRKTVKRMLKRKKEKRS